MFLFAVTDMDVFSVFYLINFLSQSVHLIFSVKTVNFVILYALKAHVLVIKTLVLLKTSSFILLNSI